MRKSHRIPWDSRCHHPKVNYCLTQPGVNIFSGVTRGYLWAAIQQTLNLIFQYHESDEMCGGTLLYVLCRNIPRSKCLSEPESLQFLRHWRCQSRGRVWFSPSDKYKTGFSSLTRVLLLILFFSHFTGFSCQPLDGDSFLALQWHWLFLSLFR